MKKILKLCNRLIIPVTCMAILLGTTCSALAEAALVTSSELIIDASREEELVYSENTSAFVTIDVIDDLIDQRTNAIMQGDTDEYERIEEELLQYGVKEVSIAEIAELTGADSEELSGTYSTSSSTVTFETVYTTYDSVELMRIYATPNGKEGALYKTGVTTVKNSNSATTIAMKLLKIAATTLTEASVSYAGEGLVLGKALTVYDLIEEVASTILTSISKTSTITNITASYTWNAAETCVFLYFPSPTTGSWQLKGIYSKSSVSVLVATPTLTINEKDVSTSISSYTTTCKVTPNDYNSSYYAYEAYKDGGIHTSIAVSKYAITGVEGKTVKTINLTNPTSPSVLS